MKAITTILGIAGVICLLSAAGNDDITGGSYPITHLLAWAACGMACLGAAIMINGRRAR